MVLVVFVQCAASVIIEKLFSKAISYVGRCSAGPSAVQDEIRRLQVGCLRIQTILAVLEGEQAASTKQNEVLNDWMRQLTDAVDQADHVRKEVDYYELEKAAADNKVQQGMRRNLKRTFDDYANNFFGNDDTLTKLSETVKKLDHLADAARETLLLVPQLRNSDVKRQQEDDIRNAPEASSSLIEDTNFPNLQESEDYNRKILRKIYDKLPTSLQICFRYCSIFPKNHVFEKKELINMWTCSGLIKKQVHEKQSLEDIAEKYLNHLTRKSFFDIKISGYGSNRKQYYVMNDLAHDLARLVSTGECLGIEDDGSRDIPDTIRHLYARRVNPLTISHLKNLHTLIIHLNKDNVEVFNEVLKELPSLRLLQLTVDDDKFPDEVGNLVHLRYLSLFSFGKEGFILPESVCRLNHLEVMELGGNIKIDDSTLKRMSNLTKLRLLQNRNSLEVLEIEKASSLVSLPSSMIDLQALHRLPIEDAPLLRTIPELPTSMEDLAMKGYCPELKKYIEDSGKFTNIPSVVHT